MKGQPKYMKGIDLAVAFFMEYGITMIRENFPQLEQRLAVGLIGQGSECFGFDDDISKDHDYAPGFGIYLSQHDFDEYGVALQECYARLPQEYKGVSMRQKSNGNNSKYGVFSIGDFYQSLIGINRAPEDWQEWFYIPEHALACAVNGKVFMDNLGEFSGIRSTLQKGYPSDVLYKKLAGRLALMAQAGQYNFKRCLLHGESGAAMLALYEFVKHAIHVIYLLNNTYTPFYKWQFRGIQELFSLNSLGVELQELLKCGDFNEAQIKIDNISARVATELRRRNLCKTSDDFLEAHAIELSGKITNPEIRTLHLMEFGE